MRFTLKEYDQFKTDGEFRQVEKLIHQLVSDGTLIERGLDPTSLSWYVEVYEDAEGDQWYLAIPDHAFRGYLKKNPCMIGDRKYSQVLALLREIKIILHCENAWRWERLIIACEETLLDSTDKAGALSAVSRIYRGMCQHKEGFSDYYIERKESAERDRLNAELDKLRNELMKLLSE